MQLDTWRILPRPGGSFHFGRHGLGQEETALTFSSDRLFAALVAYTALNDPNRLGELVTPTGDSPLVLTSAFPWVHGVRLFPRAMFPTKPKKQNVQPEEDNEQLEKDLKKVNFVSDNVFRQLISGQFYIEDLVKHAAIRKNCIMGLLEDKCEKTHVLIQDKSVLITAEDLKTIHADIKRMKVVGKPLPFFKQIHTFWHTGTRPRVTLDRISNASNLFFTGGVTFAPGCGLWFGIHWVDPNSPLKNSLPSLLAGLGDAGIGGDRSAGYGVCSFKKDEDPLDLPNPQKDGNWTNLSRYIPASDEIDALTANDAGYSLVRVGGHLTSNSSMGVRRKAINMIEEGALLGAARDGVVGKLADVKPTFENNNLINHPVWRNGQTIAVGVTLNGGKQ